MLLPLGFIFLGFLSLRCVDSRLSVSLRPSAYETDAPNIYLLPLDAGSSADMPSIRHALQRRVRASKLSLGSFPLASCVAVSNISRSYTTRSTFMVSFGLSKECVDSRSAQNNKNTQLFKELASKSSYMSNGTMPAQCFQMFKNQLENKILLHVFDDAKFYYKLLLRRGGGRSKRELQRIKKNLLRLQENDQALEQRLLSSTSDWVDSLDDINNVLNLAKGCIFRNKMDLARACVLISHSAWKRGKFDFTCTSSPCPQIVFKKLIFTASALNLHTLVVEWQNTFMEHFETDVDGLTIFAMAFDAVGRHFRAYKFYQHIFRLSRVQQKGDHADPLVWSVGPETASYTRALKSRAGEQTDLARRLAAVKVSPDLLNLFLGYERGMEKIMGGMNLTTSHIERRDAQTLTVEEFTTTFVNRGKPVVLMNIDEIDPAYRALRTLWSPANLKSQFGNVQVDISTSTDIVSIQQRLSFTDCDDRTSHSLQMNISMFLEQIEYGRWIPENPPYLLRATNATSLVGSLTFTKFFDSNRWMYPETVRREKALFSIGPRHSFTGFHQHSPAFNYLAHGAKKWFLMPPRSTVSMEDGETFASWFRTKYKSHRNNILEVTQTAGELLYIPGGWLHAVVNVGNKANVGVAVELGWDKEYRKHLKKTPCNFPC